MSDNYVCMHCRHDDCDRCDDLACWCSAGDHTDPEGAFLVTVDTRRPVPPYGSPERARWNAEHPGDERAHVPGSSGLAGDMQDVLDYARANNISAASHADWCHARFWAGPAATGGTT